MKFPVVARSTRNKFGTSTDRQHISIWNGWMMKNVSYIEDALCKENIEGVRLDLLVLKLSKAVACTTETYVSIKKAINKTKKRSLTIVRDDDKMEKTINNTTKAINKLTDAYASMAKWYAFLMEAYNRMGKAYNKIVNSFHFEGGTTEKSLTSGQDFSLSLEMTATINL